MGRTKAQYKTEKSIADIISKLGTAVIFGYYGVTLIDNFDYARLIWTTLQVALFICMGVITMFKAYAFVVEEFRGRIVKKIDNLQKFENYVNTSPSEDMGNIEAENIKKENQNLEGDKGNG